MISLLAVYHIAPHMCAEKRIGRVKTLILQIIAHSGDKTVVNRESTNFCKGIRNLRHFFGAVDLHRKIAAGAFINFHHLLTRTRLQRTHKQKSVIFAIISAQIARHGGRWANDFRNPVDGKLTAKAGAHFQHIYAVRL